MLSKPKSIQIFFTEKFLEKADLLLRNSRRRSFTESHSLCFKSFIKIIHQNLLKPLKVALPKNILASLKQVLVSFLIISQAFSSVIRMYFLEHFSLQIHVANVIVFTSRKTSSIPPRVQAGCLKYLVQGVANLLYSTFGTPTSPQSLIEMQLPCSFFITEIFIELFVFHYIMQHDHRSFKRLGNAWIDVFWFSSMSQKLVIESKRFFFYCFDFKSSSKFQNKLYFNSLSKPKRQQHLLACHNIYTLENNKIRLIKIFYINKVS